MFIYIKIKHINKNDNGIKEKHKFKTKLLSRINKDNYR